MAGKIVHFEIPAADAQRAKSFWSGVFGWEVGQPMSPEMDYRMFQTAPDQGGAIVGGQDPGPLTVYFDTEDIDATIGKVRELGGEAEDVVVSHPVEEVPKDAGRRRLALACALDLRPGLRPGARASLVLVAVGRRHHPAHDPSRGPTRAPPAPGPPLHLTLASRSSPAGDTLA